MEIAGINDGISEVYHAIRYIDAVHDFIEDTMPRKVVSRAYQSDP